MALRFVSMYLMVAVCLTIRPVSSYTQGTCKQIKASRPSAPSGIYHIQVGRYDLKEVYCEMGLNGGGYTFLSPGAMAEITDEDLQPLITDRKSVLMRIRRCDGTQPYSVLQQLPQYQTVPIFLGLNNYTGFQVQGNIPNFGTPYLFVGFLPMTISATNGATQGIMANKVSYTFTNCNYGKNSQMVMFPNFNEIPPINTPSDVDYPFCDNIFAGALVNPSGRVMPPEYFMFSEFHFGGCGCYNQIGPRLRNKCILGFQFGFR